MRSSTSIPPEILEVLQWLHYHGPVYITRAPDNSNLDVKRSLHVVIGKPASPPQKP